MIAVVGSLNVDLIGTVARLPAPGETVAGSTFSTAPGGKGANQALAARRAGATVHMFGAVGDDPYAEQALAALEEAGVDLAGVARIAATPTGIAMILVDALGENVIAVLPGANGAVGPSEADAAVAGLGVGDVLLVQQEVPQPATERALRRARERGIRTILNTAPFLDGTAALARMATITVANETEFALMGGGSPTEDAVAEWARSSGATVVVTLGPDGALVATPEQSFAVPALDIAPVDTVGAGDTFCGYLAAGLDAGLTLEDAARRAAVAGSLACLKPGAQPAIPGDEEVSAALSRGSR